jgi:vacuolar-type H+-ATPase subunit F/Vma7
MDRILILSLASIVAGVTMADEMVEVVDEITVMGVRDLGALRAELTRAEDEVYDLYNELNDDDDYDIICKREALIGSQIKKRICKARLYRDALSEATEDDDVGIVYFGPLVNEEKHRKILREKMRAVANQNPELIVALKKRYALEQKFNLEREKKFGSAGD